MDRIIPTALHFSTAVFCFGCSIFCAVSGPSPAAAVGVAIAIVFAALNSFLFIRSAMLFLRETLEGCQSGVQAADAAPQSANVLP